MKHRVCRADEVAENDMAAFDVSGTRVLIARVDGKLYAVDDTCSHAEASLSEGSLDCEECTVSCPLHGAVFDLQTGEALEAPADEPVTAYRVTVEDGAIYIESD